MPTPNPNTPPPPAHTAGRLTEAERETLTRIRDGLCRFGNPTAADDAAIDGLLARDLIAADSSPRWVLTDAGRAALAGEETTSDPTAPDLYIVWDPEIVGPSDYAELVAAIGDLVRAYDGKGLERVEAKFFRVKAKGREGQS